jgi:hypothetical protein
VGDNRPVSESLAPGAGTPEAAAALAKTQQITSDANDMIQRAKAAGMESDKQQTIFWRAEALAKDGKLDDGKLTQVVALLSQSKYAKAEKVLEAAEAVQPANSVTEPGAQAATATTQSAKPAAELEEVEIVGDKKNATPAATAQAAPKIGDAVSAEPQTLAERVKQSAARAGKLKRYESLLACLNRK